MSMYLVTLLAREDHGWSEIATTYMDMTAQANSAQLKRDVIENTQDKYSDDEPFDNSMINSVADRIGECVGDIDGDGLYMPEVKAILRDMLDVDMVNIESIDISDFIDVTVSVDTDALCDEIKDNKLITELQYSCVFDALGTLMYEVSDPDNVLLGKVMVTWLEG